MNLRRLSIVSGLIALAVLAGSIVDANEANVPVTEITLDNGM